MKGMHELLAALLGVMVAQAAGATEIRVLSAGAIEPGLKAAAAAYQRETGIDVRITFATAPQLRKRVGGGEAADVVIAPPPGLSNSLS
jgi:molybdate transport system substrate-binding protein